MLTDKLVIYNKSVKRKKSNDFLQISEVSKVLNYPFIALQPEGNEYIFGDDGMLLHEQELPNDEAELSQAIAIRHHLGDINPTEYFKKNGLTMYVKSNDVKNSSGTIDHGYTNHILSLVYDPAGKRFIIVDTLNYNQGHADIANSLTKNKNLLANLGVEFETVKAISNVYDNGDNDCAINAALNSVLVPHLLSKSEKKIELNDLRKKINIIGETEEFKNFRRDVREAIKKNQSLPQNTVEEFLKEADNILYRENLKQLVVLARGIVVPVGHLAENSMTSANDKEIIDSYTSTLNNKDKTFVLTQNDDTKEMQSDKKINLLALKENGEQPRTQYLSLIPYNSNDEDLVYEVSFENARVEYKGENECAYGKILGEYMKLNPNVEVIADHKTSKEAIIQCSQWLEEIKKSTNVSSGRKNELEEIFLMAVAQQTGFDNSKSSLKKGKDILKTIIQPDIQL